MHASQTEPPERWAVFQQSARELIPARYYPLFLAVLAVSTMAISYAFIHPINEMDWIRTVQQVRNMWRGVNPYCLPYCEFRDFDPDLLVDDSYVTVKGYSPWVMFYLSPLAYITTRGMIALTIAAWVVIIIDSGRPFALLLVIHPAFLMLWASANADFLINGVGLWLILRGVRGIPRGLTLLLMALKPQILPFVILLEGFRAIWERDWKTIGVAALVGIFSVLLYPAWLTDTLPSIAYLKPKVIIHADPTDTEDPFEAFSFSIFGAWGIWASLGVTAAILLLMRRRLTEWRTLAVLLGFVWSFHLSLYNYALLLLLFRNAAPWRILAYLGISLALLPIFFTEYHSTEQIGVLLFLLLAALLSPPDPDQAEEAIAARRGVPPLPGVRALSAGVR